MKKNSFVEGTIIASLAIIFIKILGALYVIPFYSIIGEKGGALYSYAYNIYNLFLNISTAGIPIAMSKIISEYNALEMYEAKERSYKIGKNIIFLISTIAFLILFVFAEDIAILLKGDMAGGNSITDIGFVIRSVSLCLMIIPFLSVTRGYFQGHKYISPSSTSQIIEQVIRILVILLGSYFAIKVFKLKVSYGVSIALLGASIGGLIAYIYLRVKLKKHNKNFNISNTQDKISNKDIIKKIIKYSIPLIIISIASDIYSLVDLTLVIRGMNYLGYSAYESETIASIIATWGQKICMIVNSIAMGISVSLIPHIVSSFVKEEKEETNKKFNQAVNVIIVTALPLTIGISLLSRQFYTLFYGESIYGGIILSFLVWTALFASVHIVVSNALQSMNKYKIIYLSTILGFVINAALDIPLIILFNKLNIYPYYGAIAATLLGYSFTFLVSFKFLKKNMSFKYKSILINIKKAIIASALMIIPIILLNKYFNNNFSGRLMQIPIILLNALISGSIYIYISYKNNVLKETFGENNINIIVNKFKKIFKLKK